VVLVFFLSDWVTTEGLGGLGAAAGIGDILRFMFTGPGLDLDGHLRGPMAAASLAAALQLASPALNLLFLFLASGAVGRFRFPRAVGFGASAAGAAASLAFIGAAAWMDRAVLEGPLNAGHDHLALCPAPLLILALSAVNAALFRAVIKDPW
jgi:hypothetical protein